MQDSIPVMVRMPPELKATLARLASRDGRTLSSLMRKVLSDWVKKQKL